MALNKITQLTKVSLINPSITINQENATSSQSWDPQMVSWKKRIKLTMNNSAQTENLANFSVMVKLTPQRIDYSQFQTNGEDIRFIDPDGTILDYEIDIWDPSGISILWVNIPQVDGSSNTDHFFMYYLNPLAPS